MNNSEKEISLMKVSAGLTVVFGIAGLAMAILTDSMSILLDALYGIADMVISIIAVFAVKKIHSPPDRKYHYGYAKLEPFMTGINGTLILCLCICTIVTSIQDLTHADPVDHMFLIILYSFISFVVCLGFAIYMKICGRMWRSEVVLVDSHLWMTEAIISAAICFAFGFGYISGSLHVWEEYTAYIDPITCMILSLFLILHPSKIIWASFQDMLDACPPDDISSRIRSLADASCPEYGFAGVKWMRMRKAGRYIFLTICFFVPKEKSISEMNNIREQLVKKMKDAEPGLDVCILFSDK